MAAGLADLSRCGGAELDDGIRVDHRLPRINSTSEPASRAWPWLAWTADYVVRHGVV